MKMMSATEVQKLCDLYNFVWATRRVAEDAASVSYMLRTEPNAAIPSSGWLFLSTKDETGIESAEDLLLVSLERVLKNSPTVSDYLHLPVGSQLHCEADRTFILVQK